ncbi:hypothetical protein PRIPAC_85144 [Pristionchus pacificus]|uniref:Uncharacterized protein n=1 Tax=Pristionchus pacificus TaxID=54126 RepID=A0A2A6CEI8_PRIPA|nr:hypothetical protein PRIPAC_85144 [Pristionchus pacificus]|eukprot:PDM76539.1 hypothetical protein PRIPAC_42905 [Pristionchus pacificus]
MRKFRRETLSHLFDWHKSTLSVANWVSRVKILRKNEVPSTGMFTYLYEVKHVEIFKKPWTRLYLPTEIYGNYYGDAILRSRVGREYLIRGGGMYWHSQTGDVPMRDDEALFLERWEDLTDEYVYELKTFLRKPVVPN